MKKSLYAVVCLMFALVMVTGCGQKNKVVNVKPTTNFKAANLSADKYVQKVDTFVVVLDASDSMELEYLKGSKERAIDTAKKFVVSMIKTLPDLEYTGALRVFGLPKIPHSDDTPILYWATESNRDKLLNALNGVNTGRNSFSSLALTLNRTADTLLAVDSQPALSGKTLTNVGVDITEKAFKSPKGKIAVIVVSDGKDDPKAAQMAAKHLMNRFDGKLNIYSVVAGNDIAGKSAMEQLASIGKGFAVGTNDLTSAASMQNFLEKTLIAPDEDNDMVADATDKCPGSPMGVLADRDGCTPDTDNDGVYDYLDRCPRTPEGLAVNAMGCPADTDADGKYDDQDQSPTTPEWINDLKWGSVSPAVRYLRYDVNAYELRPWMYALLDEYVAFLKIHGHLTLGVRGYASNPGSNARNNELSKKRAQAVKAYLIRAGVNPSQLSVSYHGKADPLGDSNTAQGRALNRRVELEIMR